MLITIERMETAGPDRRARRLFISDNPDPRTTAAAVVMTLGIEEGTVYEMDAFFHDVEEAEDSCGRERALGVIGYRERSGRELERRLTNDGYPEGVVRRIVDRFRELGLVDDARFASMWARSRVSAGYGPQRVSMELARKGVAPILIDQAMSEAFGEEDMVDRARTILRGRTPASRKDRERMIRKLVSRGFSLSIAIAAIDSEAEPPPPFLDDNPS